MSDRARVILFWFTIILMLAVAVLAAVTILRACGGLPAATESPLSITPAEISLCPGDQQQFAAAGDGEVTWEASGGTISSDGVYQAGEAAGDYTVSAARTESRRAAGAIVHIIPCTATPTVTPLPTLAPTATPEPADTPEPTEPAEPSSASPDVEGDVGEYETGTPVDTVPTGVDISDASVGPNGLVDFQRNEQPPEELADWVEEGESLFWILLYEPVPEQPTSYMNWLFVFDVDGNPDTGRAAGSARINPDLGDEVAIGVSYDANTEIFESYSLVWDSEGGVWAEGPDVRYTFGDSRSVVGLAFSLETLQESIAQAEAGAIAPDAAAGRAAAETYLADGTRVIDFYPGLPE